MLKFQGVEPHFTGAIIKGQFSISAVALFYKAGHYDREYALFDFESIPLRLLGAGDDVIT